MPSRSSASVKSNTELPFSTVDKATGGVFEPSLIRDKSMSSSALPITLREPTRCPTGRFSGTKKLSVDPPPLRKHLQERLWSGFADSYCYSNSVLIIISSHSPGTTTRVVEYKRHSGQAWSTKNKAESSTTKKISSTLTLINFHFDPVQFSLRLTNLLSSPCTSFTLTRMCPNRRMVIRLEK